MRKHYLPLVVCAILAMGGLTALNSPVQAALDPYDPPTVECLGSTLNSLTLKICAGATGSPAGLTLQWKKLSDWEMNGWSDAGDLCKLSMSGQPSLQHPGKSRWELLPGECESIVMGDINFDETGVSGEGCGLDAFECGTDYVFRAFSHAGRGMGRSAWTSNIICSTSPCVPRQCTHTMTYWKTHGAGTCHEGANADEWPVSAIPMMLGTRAYTAAMLCDSYNVPAAANGLISLAHQLITARLNLAAGAASCPALTDAIAQADALILNRWVPPNQPQGFLSPVLTSPLTMTLNTYNNGGLCPENCQGAAPQARLGRGVDTAGELTPNGAKTTWGKLKAIYR